MRTPSSLFFFFDRDVDLKPIRIQRSKLGIPANYYKASPDGDFLLRESVPYKLPIYYKLLLQGTEPGGEI